MEGRESIQHVVRVRAVRMTPKNAAGDIRAGKTEQLRDRPADSNVTRVSANTATNDANTRVISRAIAGPRMAP
jgi:hypothetical protein